MVDDDRPLPGRTEGTEDLYIRTFLVADVRGYTLFTQERGDEAAGKLAAKFARLAREGVEGRGGTLLELRGDEALCVFASPRQAIRAAVELQERFVDETLIDPELPLTVGIGLDAGEAVAVEGGYRGGALNLAARLCGQARAGEILASREVAHLARRTDGVRYEERESLWLKGLAEPVPIVRVRPEGIDAVERLMPFAPARLPEPGRRPDRRWLAVGAVVLAVALIAVAVPLIRSGDGGVAPEANSVAKIDIGSGTITLTTPLGARPGAAAFGFGSLWVAEPDRGVVVRMDGTNGQVRDTIPVGESPAGLAVGEGSVWVTNGGEGTVSRISPETNRVTQELPVGSGPSGIAVGDGSLWVADSGASVLVRVVVASGKTTPVPLAARPTGVAYTSEGVWVSSSAASTLSRIDPRSLQVTTRAPVGNGPTAVLPAFGSIWVANSLDGTVFKVDPQTGHVRDAVPVGESPNALAAVGGSIWVANEFAGTVVPLDPDTGRAGHRVQAEGSVAGIVGTRDTLWAAIGPSPTSHRGGTLRIASKDGPTTYDPAFAYDTQIYEILTITNDGLVAFKKSGGAEGTTLVPDLASALPDVSGDGLTYRFPLRSGIRYSTGEPVHPEDFRYALERAFSLSGDAMGEYPSLAGARACFEEPTTCDLSSEIEVDQDAITFHLAFPDPDLPYRLALPFAFPVPVGTPIEDQGFDPVPATGPYEISSADEEGVVLERNEGFRQWSAAAQPDGFVDRIEWTFGKDTDATFDRLLAGRVDWVADIIPFDALAELTTSYPGQLVQAALPVTDYMAINLDAAPFDDPRVRRAVNFAVDRAHVQELLGGEQVSRVTCQILPLNFPAYEPFCPYTKDPGSAWSRPDMGRALELVRAADVAGAKVDVWAFDFVPGFVDTARYFVRLLDRLGLDAKLHVPPDDKVFTRSIYRPDQNGIEMFMIAWYADYPEPGGFIGALFACDSPWNNGGYCDPAFDDAMAEAGRLALADPAEANAAWAQLDRRLVKEAVWVPLRNPIKPHAFSERVGDVQIHPQWELLLSRLWVQ
jgi:peptide/nickel transport system substrate-binding protein